MGGSFSATNHVLPIPGGLSMGGRFQLQTTYSRFRRGVGHGRVVFSYKPCTPDSGGGGWPWGVLFQLQTTYSRFRRKKPVQRALILGASRLNGCTHFPDGGEAVWPDPGTLAQDPPARPFSGPRKARFDAPGADFSASLKKSGKESPRPVFSAPGGVGHGGCFFSYKPRTPDSQGGLAMGGSFSATNCVLPIPATKIVVKIKFHSGVRFKNVYRFSRPPFWWGAYPLVVKQNRHELATIHVMLIPGPFWPPDWYQKAYLAHQSHIRVH